MAFKTCPRCGKPVRQIDPKCWNCGSRFDGAQPVVPHTPKTPVELTGRAQKKIAKFAWGCLAAGAVLFVGLVVLVIVLVSVTPATRPGPQSPPQTGQLPGKDARALPHSTEAPPAALLPRETKSLSTIVHGLALIHEGGEPSAESVRRFRAAMTTLIQYCPEKQPERLADMLIAGHEQLRERGHYRTDLLALTEATATMLDTAANSGGMLMKSCAEPIAVLVVALTAGKD